jgi:hypothetical protein
VVPFALLAILLVLIAAASRNTGKPRPKPSRFHLFWTRGDLSELPKRWAKRRDEKNRAN